MKDESENILLAMLLVMSFCIITLVIVTDWTLHYNSLSSGYSLTIDLHAEEIEIGTPVTVWAGTTNPNTDEIKF